MMESNENLGLPNLEMPAKAHGPVECLGMTFENDDARREYFIGLLREGLEELHAKLGGVPFTTVDDAVERMKLVEKWPMGDETHLCELAERMRHAESTKDLLQRWKDEVGFPHGEIEYILNLSDPPYYTACPNPFVDEFIKHCGKPYDPNAPYSKEPFTADVSEGKNDPIYNAHSYHTKVPHKAIMRYILHYTEPGDIVFDGFCGTGMTGVAAQLCGDRKAVESLGYKLDEQGIIYRKETDENDKTIWTPFSKLGPRRAVLNDLSPAATFIACNYNTPVDVQAFEREAKRILKEVEEECGWMYLTLHQPTEDHLQLALSELDELRNGKLADRNSVLPWARINYTVWSDVFVCPNCTHEVIFWEAAVDKDVGRVPNEFPCPHCNALLTKRNMDRAWVTKFDKAIAQTIRQPKQAPVLINYSIGKRHFEKAPDAFDLALIEKIESIDITYWFPIEPMMFKGEQWGDTWRAGYHAGITHVHHFYTKRNLLVLGAIHSNLRSRQSMLLFNSQIINISRLNRYRPEVSFPYNPLSGTLYVGSQVSEANVFTAYENKITRLVQAYAEVAGRSYIVTQSATNTHACSNSVDYIFTDPPFGGNLMYSELNFLSEIAYHIFPVPNGVKT